MKASRPSSSAHGRLGEHSPHHQALSPGRDLAGWLRSRREAEWPRRCGLKQMAMRCSRHIQVVGTLVPLPAAARDESQCRPTLKGSRQPKHSLRQADPTTVRAFVPRGRLFSTPVQAVLAGDDRPRLPRYTDRQRILRMAKSLSPRGWPYLGLFSRTSTSCRSFRLSDLCKSSQTPCCLILSCPPKLLAASAKTQVRPLTRAAMSRLEELLVSLTQPRNPLCRVHLNGNLPDVGTTPI